MQEHWESTSERQQSATDCWLLSPVYTSNNVEATFHFDEATFDSVAKIGNNVVRVYCKISAFQQSRTSTLLPFLTTMSNEFFVKFRPFDKVETNCTCSICVWLCQKNKISFKIVAKNGNNVEATFDFVVRIVRLVAFDNVASTLLLVWTGL